MENLGHVRVQTMRDFIEKNKDYFVQRKIKTLKKQEAIDVIKNKFNEGNVPANIMKEWERITVRKEKETFYLNDGYKHKIEMNDSKMIYDVCIIFPDGKDGWNYDSICWGYRPDLTDYYLKDLENGFNILLYKSL